MRRAFASEAEFEAWHENAKTAAGLPVVGVNARTDQPAPDKQQTTDLTALSRDEDGNVVLEATVTDDTLARRGFQDALIRADLLTADEVAELAGAYESWAPGTAYEAGDLREHAGTLWKCVQGHTSQSDWQPPVVPALWTHAAPDGVIPEWTQPTGSHDVYPLGFVVTHLGKLWQSLIPANDTVPGSDPRWWLDLSEPDEPAEPDAWAAGVAYTVGQQVTYQGSTYTCLQAHTSQAGWTPTAVPALWQLVP